MEKVQANKLATMPISKLFWIYVGNGLLYTFIMVIQSQADGVFVGMGLGSLGLAAIAITTPIVIISAAASLLFVMGGSSLASEALAQGRDEDARQYYAISTVTCFIMFGIISVILIIFIEPFVKFLGATEEVVPYAKEYLIWFLILFAPQTVGLNAMQFFNVEGKPALVTKWMLAVCIIGVPVEYILVVYLKTGLMGAAIGYCLPFVLLCLIMVKFQRDANSVFKIKKSDIIPDWKKFREVLLRGCPFFFVSFSAAMTVIYINNVRADLGMSVVYGAAYGVCQGYFKTGVSILTQGVFKGFAPLFSYNYGAKLFDRSRKIFEMYLIRTFLIMLILVGTLCLFSKQLGMIFAGGDEEIAEMVRFVVIAFLGMYPIGVICQIVGSYYMCLGKVVRSFIIGSSRQFWIMIPVVMIMSKIASTKNFFFFGSISDALGGILAIVIALYELKKLKAMPEEPRLEERAE